MNRSAWRHIDIFGLNLKVLFSLLLLSPAAFSTTPDDVHGLVSCYVLLKMVSLESKARGHDGALLLVDRKGISEEVAIRRPILSQILKKFPVKSFRKQNRLPHPGELLKMMAEQPLELIRFIKSLSDDELTVFAAPYLDYHRVTSSLFLSAKNPGYAPENLSEATLYSELSAAGRHDLFKMFIDKGWSPQEIRRFLDSKFPSLMSRFPESSWQTFLYNIQRGRAVYRYSDKWLLDQAELKRQLASQSIAPADEGGVIFDTRKLGGKPAEVVLAVIENPTGGSTEVKGSVEFVPWQYELPGHAQLLEVALNVHSYDQKDLKAWKEIETQLENPIRSQKLLKELEREIKSIKRFRSAEDFILVAGSLGGLGGLIVYMFYQSF